MSTSDLIGLIGITLGLLSFVGGVILWYKGAVEKRYAAERDFAHIRRNQEQIINNLETLFGDLDGRIDTSSSALVEIRSYVVALSQRFELILARLEANSNLYPRKREQD